MSRSSFICSHLVALPRRALLILALVTFAAGGFGAEPAAPPVVPGKADETNSQDTLRAYLQIQEQLHATQLSIERSRKEADTAAAETAKVFSSRLQAIEQTLTFQRKQELEAMQSSNTVMLIVAGLFAVLGFLAMLFMAYFQWRTISRLAEISAALPVAHALGSGSPLPGLGVGDSPVVTVGPVERSSQHLLGALEQLEKRIHQLEHIPPPPLHEGGDLAQPATTPAASPNGGPPAPAAADAVVAPEAARITMLLGKGQSLLNLDQPEEALACFDQVLTLEPNHAEALVKKGAALERLRKLDEAIVCYDRAIAADGSMTVAYLYKGGLFNRMERFSEALECYEKALHTQETRRG
jgi:tetratricopeptide (TPR) repeat protein